MANDARDRERWIIDQASRGFPGDAEKMGTSDDRQMGRAAH